MSSGQKYKSDTFDQRFGGFPTQDPREQLRKLMEYDNFIRQPGAIMPGTQERFGDPTKVISQNDQSLMDLQKYVPMQMAAMVPRTPATQSDPLTTEVERAAGSGLAARGGVRVERTYKTPDSEGYDIMRGGAPIGRFNVTRSGDTARLENIYGGNANPALLEGAERASALAASRNMLGPGGMREVLRQFREMNPDVKAISGERISGARRGGGYAPEDPGAELIRQFNR